MTLLNSADKVYLGGAAAAKVYAGAVQVWPAPTAWTPADLGADLLAWFDALDAATIIGQGSGVSQWGDKSGHALHATQSNDAVRPQYQSSMMRFAGAQHLLTPQASMPVVYDYIIVGIPRWAGSYRIAMWGDNGAGLMLDPSDYLGIWSYSGFTWSGMIWPSNTSGLVYGSISNSVNAMEAYNGSVLASAGSPVQTAQVKSICRNDYGQPFGDIFELVYVTYGSPLATKQKLEGYTAWKWGLQGLLPSNHPYKNAAP